MRYVLARVEMNTREKAYRFYLSEGIRLLTVNTANMVQGSELNMTLNEFISGKTPEKQKEENEAKANEIVVGFVNKIKEYQ